MSASVVLVVAKAPVPGQVKTRLARTEGHERAAGLAAAALLDTFDVCEGAFDRGRRFVALTGDLRRASDAAAIIERLHGWTVLEQRGATLAERIANAHRDVHARNASPVVQIGMDTPHLSGEQLRLVADTAAGIRQPVLGMAEDGGWWVLASTVATDVDGLDRVPMSTPETGRLTWLLLRRAGQPVAAAPVLRDVDLAADAAHAASQAPLTRFARVWQCGTTRSA